MKHKSTFSMGLTKVLVTSLITLGLASMANADAGRDTCNNIQPNYQMTTVAYDPKFGTDSTTNYYPSMTELEADLTECAKHFDVIRIYATVNGSNFAGGDSNNNAVVCTTAVKTGINLKIAFTTLCPQQPTIPPHQDIDHLVDAITNNELSADDIVEIIVGNEWGSDDSTTMVNTWRGEAGTYENPTSGSIKGVMNYASQQPALHGIPITTCMNRHNTAGNPDAALHQDILKTCYELRGRDESGYVLINTYAFWDFEGNEPIWYNDGPSHPTWSFASDLGKANACPGNEYYQCWTGSPLCYVAPGNPQSTCFGYLDLYAPTESPNFGYKIGETGMPSSGSPYPSQDAPASWFADKSYGQVFAQINEFIDPNNTAGVFKSNGPGKLVKPPRLRNNGVYWFMWRDCPYKGPGTFKEHWGICDTTGQVKAGYSLPKKTRPTGDLDQDGDVDIDDLNALRELLGICATDINVDGFTDLDDFSLFLIGFGTTCDTPARAALMGAHDSLRRGAMNRTITNSQR